MNKTLMIIALLLLICLYVATISCSSPPAQNTNNSQTNANSSAENAHVPLKDERVQTKWEKVEEANLMDGTSEIRLVNKSIEESLGNLVVEFKGNKLNVYVSTNSIVDDESAQVRIKFDNDKPIHQKWSRSTNYKGIFSPAPYELLIKLQKSQKFYIEYQPFQMVPKTIVFEIEGLSNVLPQEKLVFQEKQYHSQRAAESALMARVMPHIHKCRDQYNSGFNVFADYWCFEDPNSEVFNGQSPPYSTKEEAIRIAMSYARAGVAFKTSKR